MSKKGSAVLNDILKRSEDEKISVGEFVAFLKHRSVALIILIFGLAQTILIIQPPGFSVVTGIPIIVLAMQLMIGNKVIWIPKKIAHKNMPQKFLRKAIRWSLPTIKWIEKWTKPRWLFMFSPWGKRAIGLFIFILALILSLPIPAGNFLPGLCITLLAFAMLQLDGIFAFLSMILSILCVYFMYSIIVYTIKVVISWVQTW